MYKFFVCLFLLCAVSATSANERVALVVGNASYQVGQLANPKNDAQDIAQTLRELGFKVQLALDTDRKRFHQAVQTFRSQLSPQTEVALLFYAGHGAQFEQESYLLPINADIKHASDLPIEAMRAKDILTQMRSTGSKVNVMVLDACRDLPFPALTRSINRGLARVQSVSSSLIAYSTSPGSVASDGKSRNSPYTSELLKHLKKPRLSLIQLFNDVGFAVAESTNGSQTPRIDISPMPAVYLAGNDVGSVPRPQVVVSRSNDLPVSNELLEPEMVFIKGGTFMMGSPTTEKGRGDNEKQYRVNVSGFHMGKTEVTNAEYARCVSAGACKAPEWKDPDSKNSLSAYRLKLYQVLISPQQPVVGVSWHNAQSYVLWLSKLTGKHYSFPTEAQWEYAARADTQTAYPWGNTIGQRQANCYSCGSNWDGKATAPVGSFAANRLGLHDMIGNVREWTCSAYEMNYNGSEQRCVSNNDARKRVLRGGSWVDSPEFVRSAYRYSGTAADRNYSVGFRLSRTP